MQWREMRKATALLRPCPLERDIACATDRTTPGPAHDPVTARSRQISPQPMPQSPDEVMPERQRRLRDSDRDDPARIIEVPPCRTLGD